MSRCPHCNGEGKAGIVHINRGSGAHEWHDDLPCTHCHGTGKVSDEKLARIQRGQAARAKRVAEGFSIREYASKLGVSMSNLSMMESGRKHND